MARNYVNDGEIVTITAPAGGTYAGKAMLIGSLFGIAADNVAEGERFALGVEGVFVLDKDGSAIAAGARVYWDNDAGRITTTAAGNYPVGVATEAASAGAEEVAVRLDGVATAPVV